MTLRIKQIESKTEAPSHVRVYHVANPTVPGRVVDIPIMSCRLVEVVFEEPVGFSENLQKGERTDWLCSRDLLFFSPEEALANSKS